MGAVAGALSWDGTGARKYETGVSKGVLYTYNSTTSKWEGEAWNGLTAVTESPEGAEKTDLYADNIKYASLRSAETFGGTIEAYTYPDSFGKCDGSVEVVTGVHIGQQAREKFRLVYVSEEADDQTAVGKYYKIHIIYNCTCSPSEKAYSTINDSPEAITFSWEFDSDPVALTNYKAVSEITIDSRDFSETAAAAALTAFEKMIFGDTSVVPYCPDPSAVITALTVTT